MGHTYTKKSVVHLKLKFRWAPWFFVCLLIWLFVFVKPGKPAFGPNKGIWSCLGNGVRPRWALAMVRTQGTGGDGVGVPGILPDDCVQTAFASTPHPMLKLVPGEFTLVTHFYRNNL